MGNFFEEKGAGARAFELFVSKDYRLTTFFPTMLLNIPGFMIGAEAKSIPLTNSLLSIITPLLALRLLSNQKKLLLSQKLIF